MNTLRNTILCTLVVAIALPALAHGTVEFVGGQWWNGATFEPKTMYSVEGVLRESIDDGATTTKVDLGGAFVVPAFGDAHQHAFADGADLDAQISNALRSGIFYFANPNNSERLTRDARDRVNRPESVDVIYSNGGLTASGGHPTQIYAQIGARIGLRPGEADGQAYFIVDDRTDLDAQWPEILEGKPDFIKTYLETSEEYAERKGDPSFVGRRGLDPELLPAIVKKAHSAGLRVACHASTRNDVLVAIRSGVDILAHLPLELLTEEDAEEMANRGMTVVTTVLSHRPSPGVNDLRALHRSNLDLLVRHGVRLALGVDNGGVDVVEEALAVLDLGVIDERNVLQLLSVATPRLIFPERRIGCLDDGCEASFLALSADPLEDLENVRSVVLRVKRGHVLNVPEPDMKRSVLDAISGTFHREGVDAALSEYRRLRREEPDDWDFSEQGLNSFGYQLLQHGAVDAATKVFATNAEFFPDSFNVWDSLAEGWMKKGERAKAIELYEKSLRLNPHNENAVKMLETLRAKE